MQSSKPTGSRRWSAEEASVGPIACVYGYHFEMIYCTCTIDHRRTQPSSSSPPVIKEISCKRCSLVAKGNRTTFIDLKT